LSTSVNDPYKENKEASHTLPSWPEPIEVGSLPELLPWNFSQIFLTLDCLLKDRRYN
jgi:hypothetical protein